MGWKISNIQISRCSCWHCDYLHFLGFTPNNCNVYQYKVVGINYPLGFKLDCSYGFPFLVRDLISSAEYCLSIITVHFAQLPSAENRIVVCRLFCFENSERDELFWALFFTANFETIVGHLWPNPRWMSHNYLCNFPGDTFVQSTRSTLNGLQWAILSGKPRQRYYWRLTKKIGKEKKLSRNRPPHRVENDEGL